MAYRTLTCPNCGGMIKTFDETTKKGFCPFCDAVILDVQERQNEFAFGSQGEVLTREADFIIRGGFLERYNGESVNVVIPNGVRIIGDEAFRNMRALESVVIPDSVYAIGTLCTSAGKGPFSNCTRLMRVSMPVSVQTIGASAFDGCEALMSVDLSHVRQFGQYAFRECVSLRQLNLSSASEIRQYAFCGCRSLSQVAFPLCALKVQDGTFRNCPSLSELYFRNDVEWTSGNRVSSFDFMPEFAEAYGFLGACDIGNLNYFTNQVTPSHVRKVYFQTSAQLQRFLGPNGMTSIAQDMETFDKEISKLLSQHANLGFFQTKEKEQMRRRIGNLQALKPQIACYYPQFFYLQP